MKEFELVEYLISSLRCPEEPGALGPGDDCAVLPCSSLKDYQSLLITTDSMIAERHFSLEGLEPAKLGWKVMAQAASDIAAMGGEPICATLALTLPENKLPDESLDEGFIKSLFQGIEKFNTEHDCYLAGGDTCRGKGFSLTVTFIGKSNGKPLRRDGAGIGETIWVSGKIGLAGLGLKLTLGQDSNTPESLQSEVLEKFNSPHPRIQLGLALSELATSMIDVSDGLLADLGHICNRSRVSASLNLDSIPVAEFIWGDELQTLQAASAGEDYELLFTARKEDEEKVLKVSSELGLELTPIGEIIEVSSESQIAVLSRGQKYSSIELLKKHGLSPRGGWEHQ